MPENDMFYNDIRKFVFVANVYTYMSLMYMTNNQFSGVTKSTKMSQPPYSHKFKNNQTIVHITIRIHRSFIPTDQIKNKYDESHKYQQCQKSKIDQNKTFFTTAYANL